MATKTIPQLTAAAGAQLISTANLFEADDGSGNSIKLTAAQMGLITPLKVVITSPMTDGTAISNGFNHGLGAKPSRVRVVLLCTTADGTSGALAGDEIDVAAISDQSGGQTPNPFANFGASATVVFVGTTNAPGATLVTNWRAGQNLGFTSLTNFSLKIYAGL